MKLSEILRLVWINLIQNKFKVVLTSIGIVVGAATIVMVIAIGRGGQMDVADQFKNLNAGAIDISYEQSTDSSSSNSKGSSKSGSKNKSSGGNSESKGNQRDPGGFGGGQECRRCPEVHRAETVRNATDARRRYARRFRRIYGRRK